MRKPFLLFVVAFMFLLGIPTTFCWATCLPATLPSNPSPVIINNVTNNCIASTENLSLNLNESWSKKIQLVGGKSYWFAASKCARGRTLFGEARDDQGKLIKSDSGSSIGFCFTAPQTGTYTVSYQVTALNSGYSYAVTDSCLSESSKCP